MAELNFAAIPLRRVKRVQFGILGPEEVVSLAVIKTFFLLYTRNCLYLTETHVCHGT